MERIGPSLACNLFVCYKSSLRRCSSCEDYILHWRRADTIFVDLIIFSSALNIDRLDRYKIKLKDTEFRMYPPLDYNTQMR